MHHGLVAGINAVEKFKGTNKKITFSEKTMIGALSKYIATENKHFQPMNANFGILPELETKIRDKRERYVALAKRAIEELRKNIFNCLQ